MTPEVPAAEPAFGEERFAAPADLVRIVHLEACVVEPDTGRFGKGDHMMVAILASWGPAVPHDFVHNYEVDEIDFRPAADPVAA